MKNKMSGLVLAALLVGVAVSYGTELIEDVSIKDVSSEFSNAKYRPTDVYNLLGGVGLGVNGPDTHSTVWASSYARKEGATMWGCGAAQVAGEVYVIFDLNEVYKDLDSVKIWNFNRPGSTATQGAGTIDILVSEKRAKFGDKKWILDSSVTLSEAPGDDTSAFGDTFPINTANVRYVMLYIKTKANGDPAGYLVGLSEVQFFSK